MGLMEEFKTPLDLLLFVLHKCGNMRFRMYYTDEIGRRQSSEALFDDILLIIEDDLDMTRLGYAISLLKEKFDRDVTVLYIWGNDEIEEGHLDKSNITKLVVSKNKVPDLPLTIRKVEIDEEYRTIHYFLQHSKKHNDYSIYNEVTRGGDPIDPEDVEIFTDSYQTLEEAVRKLKERINEYVNG